MVWVVSARVCGVCTQMEPEEDVSIVSDPSALFPEPRAQELSWRPAGSRGQQAAGASRQQGPAGSRSLGPHSPVATTSVWPSPAVAEGSLDLNLSSRCAASGLTAEHVPALGFRFSARISLCSSG